MFILSMVSYGVAALLAMLIYWPAPWRMNVAHDVAEHMRVSLLTPTKLRWDLALGHQQAIAHNNQLVGGWSGQAMRFPGLIVATALVVLFAGGNVYLQTQQPAEPEKPTHVVIDKG